MPFLSDMYQGIMFEMDIDIWKARNDVKDNNNTNEVIFKCIETEITSLFRKCKDRYLCYKVGGKNARQMSEKYIPQVKYRILKTTFFLNGDGSDWLELVQFDY